MRHINRISFVKHQPNPDTRSLDLCEFGGGFTTKAVRLMLYIVSADALQVFRLMLDAPALSRPFEAGFERLNS